MSSQNGVYKIFRGTAFFLIVVLIGCARAKDPNANSSITIKAPNSKALSKAMSAFSAIPSDRQACFGVNVSGENINTVATSCSPSMGIVAGFVPDNATFTIDVPRGLARKFDLFMYLAPLGSTCPVMGSSLAGERLQWTYLIGTATADLVSDVQTLTIPISFQGVANNISQDYNLATSCLVGAAPNKFGFSVTAAQGKATGNGLRLNGRIGHAARGSIATGGGMRLHGNPR